MRVLADRAEQAVPGTATGLSLAPAHLALPLEIADSAVLNAVTGPTRIYVRGPFASPEEDQLGDSHPVVMGLRAMLDDFESPQVGVQLHLEAGIPRDRGLGSTSADLALGALLACELVGAEPGFDRIATVVQALGASDLRARSSLSQEALLLAAGQVIPLRISKQLSLVAFVPNFPAELGADMTDRPSLEELDAESARGAGLVLALTGSLEHLMDLSVDTFGWAARERTVPASIALIGWLRQSGFPAVLSGLGPTVVSLTQVPAAVRASAEKSGWRVLDVR